MDMPAGSYLTLREFKTRHFAWSRDRFTNAWSDPFLVVEPFGEGTADVRQWATTVHDHRATEFGPAAARRLDRSLVIPLVKSDRNKFHNMITIGRAPTNDVILPDPAISKFHAFVQKDPDTGRPSLGDAESRHGTELRGLPLVKGRPETLENGDRILFADKIRATFFVPKGLFDLMSYSDAAV